MPLTLPEREDLKEEVRVLIRNYGPNPREAALLVVGVAEMIVSDCDRAVAAERRRAK
jgi:hypothetical protein